MKSQLNFIIFVFVIVCHKVSSRLTSAPDISPFPETRECASSLTNKIYGGVETEIDEFPWMALIEYEKKVGRGFHCGGSLIHKKYVLTAAHCVYQNSLPENWKPISVRLGEWDLSTDIDCNDVECSSPHKDIAIDSITVHEEYVDASSTKPNDIALVKLAEEVIFTDFIKPICLPWTEDLRRKSYIATALDVAGWGKTEISSTSTRKLKATVNEMDISDCSMAYKSLGVAVNGKQLCAGGKQGVDTCRGDSGGSLVAIDKTQAKPYYVAVGVVSFGPTPCGQSGIPGVYTRISEFVEWIRSNVEK